MLYNHTLLPYTIYENEPMKHIAKSQLFDVLVAMNDVCIIDTAGTCPGLNTASQKLHADDSLE